MLGLVVSDEFVQCIISVMIRRDCFYFRELLKHDESFYVPEVIDNLSTKRVLTTELVYGSSLDKNNDWDKSITNKVCINHILNPYMRVVFY